MAPCTSQQTVTDIQPAQVGVKNPTVESADPEGVVFWTGEEGTTIPIQVAIEDNDLSDPVTLTLELYHTGQDNRSGWTSSRTLVAENVTTGSHTFYWDGTNGFGTALPEGTYTYEVVATQTDSGNCEDCQGNPLSPEAAIEAGCIAYDTETYRSEYLTIVRAEDENGNPIYDVEYDGYDDNNTPEDESDDKYIYVIRKYVLKDSLGVNASEGVIWLYGPDGVKSDYTWNIAAQPCLNHNDTDGLRATADGLEHALRIRVPISEMEYAGTYRFVLHIKDDHSGLYRNGVDRWALDLNAMYRVIRSFTVWMTADDPPSSVHWGEDIADRVELIGYEPYPTEGLPEVGGTGRLYSKIPRLTIRTLNRLSPGDDPASPKRMSAVWAYCGHGNISDQGAGVPYKMSYLQFMMPYTLPMSDLDRAGIWAGYESPENEIQAKQCYSINRFDLTHVRLAYLASCFSAGGSELRSPPVPAVLLSVPESNSVAAHFASSGAKAVIGFRQRLAAHYKHNPYVRPTEEPYRVFHETFWNAVCNGATVGKAFDKAWGKLNGKGGLNHEYPTSAVYPILKGDRNVKIVPPKYGFE